jgi:hypothetical protein
MKFIVSKRTGWGWDGVEAERRAMQKRKSIQKIKIKDDFHKHFP